MNQWNYSNARAQFSMLINQALSGCPVEITRKGQASVIMISKSSYEAYKKAVFDLNYLKSQEYNSNINNKTWCTIPFSSYENKL